MTSLELGRQSRLNRVAAVLVRQSAKWPLLAAIFCTVNASGADVVKPITDMRANSPKEDLRLKLFKDAPTKSACNPVQIDPRGNVSTDQDLDKFLKTALGAIKAKDAKTLQPLFHARLSISLAAIEQTFAKLESVYGGPLDLSVYRLWAVNSPQGETTGLPCNDDRLLVFPTYGYPLQFAAWLQIMGQKELGRIYLAIVPADGKWNIGAFHAQQWTHDGRDFATWSEDAQKTARIGYKEAAYVKYDIAAKLLDGGGFIDIAMRSEISKARDATMTQAAWDKLIRTELKDFDVVYTSTLLVVGGGGILARVRVPQEISVEVIKETCKRAASKLASLPWGAYVEGMRCSFLLPREDPQSDGAMGGIFIAFEDVRPKQAN